MKIVGVASHICAARPKGPRYDKRQTHPQRRSIRNGIWLCEQCGREIDKDDSPYPKEVLLEWKATHEKYVATLASMGFREAFLASPVARPAQVVARRILKLFEDRRVLHAVNENETPNYILQSVERIREEMWKIAAELPDGGNLADKVWGIRQACIDFMDEVGHVDSNKRIGPNLSKWEKLLATLGAFRKTIGSHVGDLSGKYGVKVSADLAKIVPQG